MRIEPHNINAAIEAKILTPEQAQQLWAFWQTEQEDTPQFRFAHVLYYFGGLLAISAVTLFVTNAWDHLRGWPLFILSTLLFILGLLFAKYFLDKKLAIPAGIMATFSLAVVPLAVYNIQIWSGLLPNANMNYADYNYWVSWYWVPMELATLLVGAIMLYCYRFPFLLLPIAITLWYLSMDLYSLLFQQHDFTHRSIFSIYFGLAVIAAAIYMDFKHSDEKQDYAFWLYMVGVIIFWGGLFCQDLNNELAHLAFCLINIAMIFVSVILNRRVFAVFGALGVFSYLGHLAFTLFANSLGFPIALIFLGIIIILAATYWVRMEHKLTNYLEAYIPQKISRK